MLQVDNYDPKSYTFPVKESDDAQFNNIQYMYVGKNESMVEGFVGCISRVEFDDIYPLKFLFQQDGPSNIDAKSSKLYIICFLFTKPGLVCFLFFTKLQFSSKYYLPPDLYAVK